MRNLRKSSLKTLAVAFLFCGCQSHQGFKMITWEEKENDWRHQYSLNMLNNKNEVISAFYPTNQGKEECETHLKKVEKILQKQSRVKLCVRDKLEPIDNTKYPPEFHDFGILGKHESPYYSLTFDTICNSKDCYSISDTWTYTCPTFK